MVLWRNRISLELTAKLKKVSPKTTTLCPQTTKWVLLNVKPLVQACVMTLSYNLGSQLIYM